MIREYMIGDWDRITNSISVEEGRPDEQLMSERGLAITAENNNCIVGCAGIVFYDESNCEVWLKLSCDAPARVAAEAIKKGFGILKDSVGDINIYCRIKEGFSIGRRLAEWLGFTLQRIDNNFEVYKWQ